MAWQLPWGPAGVSLVLMCFCASLIWSRGGRHSGQAQGGQGSGRTRERGIPDMVDWPRRDSNPHGGNPPQDFKSRASAYSATRPKSPAAAPDAPAMGGYPETSPPLQGRGTRDGGGDGSPKGVIPCAALRCSAEGDVQRSFAVVPEGTVPLRETSWTAGRRFTRRGTSPSDSGTLAANPSTTTLVQQRSRVVAWMRRRLRCRSPPSHS